MTDLFQWVLKVSLHAAVLVPLILAIQWALRKRLSAHARYSLWWIVVLRLCIPFFPESPTSLFNWLDIETSETGFAGVLPEPHPAQSPEFNSDIPNPKAYQTGFQEEFKSEVAMTGAGSIQESIENESRTLEPIDLPSSSVNESTEIRFEKPDPGDLILWIWLMGTVGICTGIFTVSIQIRRRINSGLELSDPEILELLRDCCRIIGLRRVPSVLLVSGFTSPAIVGLINPRLIIPYQMIDRFSPAELRLIFVHELAHIKRRDILTNWIQAVLQAAHWFNPVIWFAFHRMRIDRELNADAMTLSAVGKAESRMYGDTILKLLSLQISPTFMPGAVGILEKRAQLKNRLIAISRFGQSRSWKWLAVSSISFLAAFCLTDAVHSTTDQDNAKTGSSYPENSTATSSSNPSNARSLGFRLTEYDTGEPVSDVKITVRLEQYGKVPLVETLMTDNNGVCKMSFDPKGVSKLSYDLEKSGYLYLYGEWIKHQLDMLPQTLEFKMSQGIEIGGRVTDTSGDPVEGVEVLVDRSMSFLIHIEKFHPINSLYWRSLTEEKLAVTDHSGRWSARSVWPGMNSRWIALRLRGTGFSDTVYSTQITEAMETEGRGHPVEFSDLAKKKALLMMDKGVAVTGKIRTEDGDVLPVITIACIDDIEGQSWDRQTIKTLATTDAYGAFRFAHLPKKIVRLVVQTQGFAPFVKDLDLAIADEAVVADIVLQTGESLKRTIRDKNGNPVSDAQITFRNRSS